MHNFEDMLLAGKASSRMDLLPSYIFSISQSLTWNRVKVARTFDSYLAFVESKLYE